MRPLKKLASFGSITSMRMTISPIINSLACPMIGGFFLGVKGGMGKEGAQVPGGVGWSLLRAPFLGLVE